MNIHTFALWRQCRVFPLQRARTFLRSGLSFFLSYVFAAAGFAALRELYENLHVVNRDMSRRLGAAAQTDPARNAMALLDAYTTLLPDALEGSLAELKPLFDAWDLT